MFVKKKKKIISFREKLKSFFPLQLLSYYIKEHRSFLVIWIIPFLIIFQSFGNLLGIPLLFLSPDYNGVTGTESYMFIGLATGSFFMAFNISSYVVMSYKFPFISTTSQPFYVYSQNNFIIPAIYLVFYIMNSTLFQINQELISLTSVIINEVAFVLGIFSFAFFSFTFFYLMNNVFPRLATGIGSLLQKTFLKKIINYYNLNRRKTVDDIYKEATGEQTVEYYIRKLFRIGKARKYKHYNKKIVAKVIFNQHINVVYYILLILIFILVRGQFKETSDYIPPAGASLLLLFTLITLVYSLIYILFKKWAIIFIVLAAFAVNFLYTSSELYHTAYGLDYSKKEQHIDFMNHGNFVEDSLETIKILNKWKKKNRRKGSKKPKIVIVATSGGGLKMALWTYQSLSYADSIAKGKLLNQTQLMVGSSGGMVGAAFLRELYLQKKQKNIAEYFSSNYFDDLSKNMLNSILFSFVFSDWFIRFHKFNYNNKSYFIDRAYSFEKELNANTSGFLDKPLIAYKSFEKNAEIPMLILNPSIMNTGARLIISATNVSYLVRSEYTDSLKNIEFRHNYKKFGADSLRFLTALRMQASFPYVSPNVELPGKPSLTVFDAGLNDNFGYLTVFNFVSQFYKWINKNTGGLILINIDENMLYGKFYYNKKGFISHITNSAQSLFQNWAKIQKNNNLQVINSLKPILNNKLYFVNFKLGAKNKKISMSWRLTNFEKKQIKESVLSKSNIIEIKKLVKLLE